MSWSVNNLIGTPDKIIEALNKESVRLEGKSKEEFDAALPHITGLLKLNYNQSYPEGLYELTANGHAHSSTTAGQDYSNCNVSIKPFAGKIV